MLKIVVAFADESIMVQLELLELEVGTLVELQSVLVLLYQFAAGTALI